MLKVEQDKVLLIEALSMTWQKKLQEREMSKRAE